ncbi:hypothetical protein [Hydrogenophilus thiooxidans]|uniref:hypothetical protein n=1 Tax=Hydrogenophilus thiooxidans TaxID=2820326 RepID=UPI001C246ACB|nr:hypothetical protein [Hydrogenophilus thiooxidans]
MTTAREISWDELKAMIFAHSAQLQETDRLIRELRESGKETDRRMQETDRLIRELRESGKETDRRIRALERQLGRLGNRLGQFVQDMVEPAVVRLFQEQGIPVHRVMPNVRARDDAGQTVMEIDLLVINGDHAIAVECKSRLTTDDVDEHLERLSRFKVAFPEYTDKLLHGAVAAMGAPDEVVRYAEKQGLYVLVQADDDVVVCNQPGFTPRTW